MRPVRVLSIYLAVVFLGGALIAPWVYTLVQASGRVLPFLQSVASKPFPRYLNRSLLVLALAGLVPFLRATGLGSWREIGLGRRPGALLQAGRGFVLGLLSLACIVALALTAGVRHPAQGHGWVSLLGGFAKAGLAALCVAPLEEIVFRGALFGALRTTFHRTLALALSSSIYALLHFLERPGWMDQVGWNSGFIVLAGMMGGFGDLDKLLPGFLNLTLAGMILGLAYQRSGSLYFSIGLHAGWIFWLKTYAFVTAGTGARFVWLFGTDKLIDGWLAFAILAAFFFLLAKRMEQADEKPGWKEIKLFR